MSNKIEEISNKLAHSIISASEMITDLNDVTEAEAFTIKVRAYTKALLHISETSDYSAIQLATGDKTWLAIGNIHVGGESSPALETKMMVKMIQEEVLKHEACTCENCQQKGDADTIAKKFAKAFGKEEEPSLNEQTRAEILRDIENETRHWFICWWSHDHQHQEHKKHEP